MSAELIDPTTAVAGSPDLDVSAPDLDRVRRLVPTERQLREGIRIGDDEPIRVSADQVAPKVSFGTWLKQINPLGIEGYKLPLVVFCLAGFVSGWDEIALGLAGPEIQGEFGISAAGLASLASFVTAVSTIAGLPFGYMVDRVKRVWIVRVTHLGAVLGDMLQIFSSSFGMLSAGRAVGTFARAPEAGVQYPLLSDYYPSTSRARAFASVTFFTLFGGLVAAPVAGWLIRAYGWRQASFAIGAFAAIAAFLTFLLREPPRGGVDRLEMAMDSAEPIPPPPPPSFAEALRGAWAIKSLRLQAIAAFPSAFTVSLSVLLGLIMASKFSLDPFQRSVIVAIQTGSTLPALALSAGISDRLLQRKPSTVVTLQAMLAFVAAGAMVAQAFAPTLWLFVLLSVIPIATQSLLLTARLSVQSLVIPARYRGVGLQLQTPFIFMGSLVAPLLLHTAGSKTSSIQHTFIYFSPFLVLSGFIYLASAGSVSRDIRAARAAAAAEQESERSRRDRQNKILVCRDVEVAIDEVQILFNVNLDVREGEVVALVGTNGAGKSTLLRAICGLQPATNGAIFFDGRDVTHLPTHETARGGIVYMPGGQGVFPLMTVRDNLNTAAWMTRKDTAAVETGIAHVLEMFPRLAERLDVAAGSMSGGEQQMLALSQAFLMQAKMLMIDELSLGLAPVVVEQLLGAVRQLQEQGTTIVLVEQSLNVALTIADRAVFMDKGEVTFDGPTEELLARPDLVRAIFMGGAPGGGASASSRRRVYAYDEVAPVVLEGQGLTLSYGGLNALTDVDLTVSDGEVVGIIGPNGAGKTTLFDVLSGYTRPDAGIVRIGDTDVSSMTPDARARLGLGRAFQNARLFPPLTVRENIAVALERRANRSPFLAAVWAPSIRKSEARLASRIDGLIELLGLTGYADKFVRELSTGTRRAVEVACQMAAEPKVLLLDEPSSGLAQAEVESLGPALLRIVKETGCGMLVIEHDLPLITGISDRLIAMELGTVVTTGTPQEVTTDPRVLSSYLAASDEVIERSGSRVSSVLSAIAVPAVPAVPNRGEK